MTLEWDLSDTPIARRDTAAKPPTEGELFALITGLLLLNGIAYRDLQIQDIVLHASEWEQLAQLMEYRLPEIASEFGDSQSLRERLREFVGIRVTAMSAAADRIRGSRTSQPAQTADPAGETELTPDDLPPDWRIEYEERAAIREYDGGQPRQYAEAEALREILQRMRDAGCRI